MAQNSFAVRLATMPRQTWLALAFTPAALLLCDLLLLLPTPDRLQSWAALGLAALLPGALLAELLLGKRADTPSFGERLVYSVGLGYGVLVLTLLGLSYLPGGLTFLQVALTFHVIILLFLLLVWLRGGQSVAVAAGRRQWFTWTNLTLLALLAGAAYLRFTNLSYSELHGDEAVVALRAVDVIQGWERALFVHKKGPGEILPAVALYVLTGRLTEFAAHLPFALASWTGVLATYLLARRWFGPVAGWWAAAMVMVDGYLMAFGRMLQYQSLIFLMVVLTVLAVQHALDRRPSGRYFLVAALVLATGLLAHYEAVIAVVPVFWLLLCHWQQQEGDWRAKSWLVARQLALPLVVGGAILVAFYVPFVLDPEFFRDTFAYIFGYRLAGRSRPEGLAIVAGRSTLYSSSYYFGALVILTVAGLVRAYWRYAPKVLAILLTLLLVVVMTALWSDSTAFFQLPGRLAFWLWVALFATVWLAPRLSQNERTAWLWFSAPLLGVIFFVVKPGTHVYIFFIPWAMVTGLVIAQLWTALANAWGGWSTRWLLAPAMALLVLIFGNYVYQLFVVNRIEVLRTWDENRPAGYWTSYTTPAFESIFGFPLRNGWKSIGALYAQGTLHGRFDTNDRFSTVPDWYLRGEEFCPRDDPNYYLLVPYPLPVDRPIVEEQRRQLQDAYYLWGVVTINDQPHLEIYAHKERLPAEQTATPRIIRDEEHTDFYNSQRLMPFTRNGPLGTQPIPNPTGYRFDNHIQLLGYQIDRAEVEPGGEVKVELYWRTEQPLTVNYDVSIQVIDLSDARKAGQRDGEPGCNRYPTTLWTPGDRIYDRYHVPLFPDAQPGIYSIYVTLYEVGSDGSQTLLPVTQADGQAVSGAVLGTVTVTAPQ
ncbi:MAG: ArnT family glycosyltransferase [Caldilineaceae bacterium]